MPKPTEGTISYSKKYLKKSDTVLDFACGTGLSTLELAGGVKKIDAIDTSTGMLDIARQKARKKSILNIDFRCEDISSSQLSEERYDVICAFNIFYFIKDIDETLGRIGKLLKPEGVCLSVTDCLGERKRFSVRIQGLLSVWESYPI